MSEKLTQIPEIIIKTGVVVGLGASALLGVSAAVEGYSAHQAETAATALDQAGNTEAALAQHAAAEGHTSRMHDALNGAWKAATLAGGPIVALGAIRSGQKKDIHSPSQLPKFEA